MWKPGDRIEVNGGMYRGEHGVVVQVETDDDDKPLLYVRLDSDGGIAVMRECLVMRETK